MNRLFLILYVMILCDHRFLIGTNYSCIFTVFPVGNIFKQLHTLIMYTFSGLYSCSLFLAQGWYDSYACMLY